MPRADWKLVSQSTYQIPSNVAEQRDIGSCFRSLDALISSRTAGVKKLEELKKAMLVKMFPQGDSLVPEIRFKEFNGKWEKKSYEEVLTHIPSKSFQIETSEYLESGDYPVVDQGKELVIAYSNACQRVFHASKKPVIVFGDHTREVKYIAFDFVVGADGTQLLQGVVDDTEFLSYVVSSVDIPCMGYARHFKFLQEARFCIPSLPEQRKIAAYFRALDDLLAARKAELKKLREMKSALLERMFV